MIAIWGSGQSEESKAFWSEVYKGGRLRFREGSGCSLLAGAEMIAQFV